MTTSMAQAGGGGELAIDFFRESINNLLVVVFPRSSSKNFQFALGLAMGASRYATTEVDGKAMHVACFAKTQADAGRASALLGYIGGWKGVLMFSGGKLVQSSYHISQVIACYLESCSCRDSRAHCQTIIDDPFASTERERSLSFSIRLVERPSIKQEVKIDRYSFPCKYLQSWFRFEANHPSTPPDQIQAAGVKRGCDVCPNFDPDEFKIVGTKTIIKEFFE